MQKVEFSEPEMSKWEKQKIHVTVSGEILQKLEELAKETGLSKSGVVCFSLANFFREFKSQKTVQFVPKK